MLGKWRNIKKRIQRRKIIQFNVRLIKLKTDFKFRIKWY